MDRDVVSRLVILVAMAKLSVVLAVTRIKNIDSFVPTKTNAQRFLAVTKKGDRVIHV